MFSPHIHLSNNANIPRVGVGLASVENPEDLVYQALKNGIRLIDTASIYKKDREVGNAINKAISDGITTRDEIFLVSKLWVHEKDDPLKALERQLKELGLNYVDLYLDHWPMQVFTRDGQLVKVPTHIVWKAMENLVERGMSKAIGIANYNVQRIMDLLSYAEISPSVLQVEVNPYFHQSSLINYCRSNNIAVMGYNSLCNAKYIYKFQPDFSLNLFEEPLIKALAEKYQKTPAQVILNWAVSQDIVVIPGTSHPWRIFENLDVLSFRLTNEELIKFKSLDRNMRCNDSTKWGFFEGVDFFA